MNSNGHVGGKVTPGWWDTIRQLLLFGLGLFLILYSAVTTGHDIPFLVTGLVLLGLVSVEQVFTRVYRRKENNHQ